ncbi:MAG: helix-turn-helix domain-containing protein [Clostridia bacterium]|nr:helix-turn-helix domain-containing protein [Clostridia bacterium]
MKKMSNYNSIVKGLQEAIEYEKGNLKVRTRVLEILPVDKFEKTDIKNIRKSLDLSQKTFSCLMGVSIKTIEAWESGENIPGGPAQRMLNLLRDDASIVDKFVRFK